MFEQCCTGMALHLWVLSLEQNLTILLTYLLVLSMLLCRCLEPTSWWQLLSHLKHRSSVSNASRWFSILLPNVAVDEQYSIDLWSNFERENFLVVFKHKLW